MLSQLFQPFQIRGLTLRNRIVMSPMCQYSATTDGVATDWHLVHYGARATGGVGLVMLEATAVQTRGRISVHDLGLWDDAQMPALERIIKFVHSQGAKIGVQIAHAGRKAFQAEEGHGPEQSIAPSALPQADGWRVPQEMTTDDIDEVAEAFGRAAARARELGFDVVELHGGHGYLLSSFVSPLSNVRADEYGGSLDKRLRAPVEIVSAVRAEWRDGPLFYRFSCDDYTPGGVDADMAVAVARQLRAAGVDLFDCSSGGVVADAKIPVGPGYQVKYAERVREQTGMPTAAVGLITEPKQAEEIIAQGQADLVYLGRELLRDPQWPLRAAEDLGVDFDWPKQYVRAKK